MSILLAIITGSSLGYALERGDFCFHSTLRNLFQKPKNTDLLRAYILTLLIATPAVHSMRSFGWIDPWIPPFAWQANIFGGLIFGAGMVVAASCITGLFYKLGHGMLGTLVGLATWAVGDILVYQGPLSGIRASLTTTEITLTLDEVFGSPALGWSIILGLGLVAVYWLYRAPKESRNIRGNLWGWLPLGVVVGVIISLSWLFAKAGGVNYPYGTSYVPTSLYLSLFDSNFVGGIPWIPIALISIILGAFIAAVRSKTLWVRGETGKRYLQLGLGGFFMGAGAAFAGGCNLGHSLVGVPLLSIGSIVTTFSMAGGVFLAHQINIVWKKSKAETI